MDSTKYMYKLKICVYIWTEMCMPHGSRMLQKLDAFWEEEWEKEWEELKDFTLATKSVCKLCYLPEGVVLSADYVQ